MKVFYAWHPDMPESTNRDFIREALTRVVARLGANGLFKVEPLVERDRLVRPWNADAHMRRIDACHVLVIDVSLIQRRGEFRQNPDVLLELACGMCKVGPRRIIMLHNSYFSPIREQFLNEGMGEMITYECGPGTDSKDKERNGLESSLDTALRTILQTIEEDGDHPDEPRTGPIVDDWATADS